MIPLGQVAVDTGLVVDHTVAEDNHIELSDKVTQHPMHLGGDLVWVNKVHLVGKDALVHTLTSELVLDVRRELVFVTAEEGDLLGLADLRLIGRPN